MNSLAATLIASSKWNLLFNYTAMCTDIKHGGITLRRMFLLFKTGKAIMIVFIVTSSFK